MSWDFVETVDKKWKPLITPCNRNLLSVETHYHTRNYISCVMSQVVLDRIHERFLKQEVQFPLYSLDDYIGVAMGKSNRQDVLMPDSIRCIVSGPSGSGKTFLYNLLFDLNGLRKYLSIFKSLYQPKYELLKSHSQKAKALSLWRQQSSYTSKWC